jgi:hypothetical protein
MGGWWCNTVRQAYGRGLRRLRSRGKHVLSFPDHPYGGEDGARELFAQTPAQEGVCGPGLRGLEGSGRNSHQCVQGVCSSEKSRRVVLWEMSVGIADQSGWVAGPLGGASNTRRQAHGRAGPVRPRRRSPFASWLTSEQVEQCQCFSKEASGRLGAGCIGGQVAAGGYERSPGERSRPYRTGNKVKRLGLSFKTAS